MSHSSNFRSAIQSTVGVVEDAFKDLNGLSQNVTNLQAQLQQLQMQQQCMFEWVARNDPSGAAYWADKMWPGNTQPTEITQLITQQLPQLRQSRPPNSSQYRGRSQQRGPQQHPHPQQHPPPHPQQHPPPHPPQQYSQSQYQNKPPCLLPSPPHPPPSVPYGPSMQGSQDPSSYQLQLQVQNLQKQLELLQQPQQQPQQPQQQPQQQKPQQQTPQPQQQKPQKPQKPQSSTDTKEVQIVKNMLAEVMANRKRAQSVTAPQREPLPSKTPTSNESPEFIVATTKTVKPVSAALDPVPVHNSFDALSRVNESEDTSASQQAKKSTKKAKSSKSSAETEPAKLKAADKHVEPKAAEAKTAEAKTAEAKPKAAEAKPKAAEAKSKAVEADKQIEPTTEAKKSKAKTVDKPTADKPTAEKPTAEKPTAAKQSVEPPVADKQSVADESRSTKPKPPNKKPKSSRRNATPEIVPDSVPVARPQKPTTNVIEMED